MWKIKDIKTISKQILKKNLWTLLLAGIFMTFIAGRYIINNDAFSNLKIVYDYIRDRNAEQIITSDDRGQIINKYLDELLSQIFTGDYLSGFINQYNESHNITKGVIFTIFDVLLKRQTQIQNIINSIRTYGNENYEIFTSTLLLIAAILGLFIRGLVIYPLRIGESRLYLESINYPKTRVRRIAYAFRKGRYFSSVKTLLLMEIYKILWNFTIIGGLIKNYSYKMVTYIIAENPNIKARDAIKISREMMNGNKWNALKLDFSFLGWVFLQFITFGLAGIYVTPYYSMTYTELYKVLRFDYIKNKKYKYEMLNDEKLFEENDLEKYPDQYEIQKKKIKIDYNKKYEPSSIILFFFIFSFVGWLWEVLLYLVRDGILVNRGVMYGPWLPIYGTGCTIIILLTRFKNIRKMLKKPFITFIVISILCSVIEYFTSWYIEKTTGLRYWDYTGVFGNINGRICLECSIFFGLGGSLCVYIVAPFLERQIQKLTNKVKITICTLLITIFFIDHIYSKDYPHTGDGITMRESIDEK